MTLLPAALTAAAVAALTALLLWRLRRGGADAADLDDDSREWLDALAAKPTRAERRTGRAYLETALGHTYVPVRRHHGRRA